MRLDAAPEVVASVRSPPWFRPVGDEQERGYYIVGIFLRRRRALSVCRLSHRLAITTSLSMGFVKGINHGVRFSSIICVVVVHVLVSVQLFLVVIIHLVLDLCPAWYVSFWFVLRVWCIVVGMLYGNVLQGEMGCLNEGGTGSLASRE